ncbi:MAG: hypothetical protein RBS77_01500 [Candidatus Moranbacteria bacterium]|jgi:hypothetical protein|nr:hypothetical protein [Candidatus Moranbacteria bacterium]
MASNAEFVDIMGFREYDEAIAKLLTVTIYPDKDDRSIAVTVAPKLSGMQKEFAGQDKMNPTRPKQKQIKDDKTVVYPASALTRLGWEFDLSRWTKVGYRKLNRTEEGNRIMQSKHPMPYEIQYQLDIVTKMRSTMNMIVRAIALKFVDREVWVPVYTGEVFGTKLVPVKLAFGGPQDQTDWEHDENKDTVFRMVFTFNMEVWLFPDVTSVPTVKKISVVSDDGVVLSETTDQDVIDATRRVENARFSENT